jgi:hypothetical protein
MRNLTNHSSGQAKRVARLLSVAEIGYAHWFFGNLYEAVVKVPDLLAKDYGPDGADRGLRSLFSKGSPVRYYIPGVPVVIGATTAALITGWKSLRNRPGTIGRRSLAVLAASAFSSIALTAYLIPTVNLKLFVAGASLTKAKRDRLLRIWYRGNVIRLLTTGTSWLVAAQLASHARVGFSEKRTRAA